MSLTLQRRHTATCPDRAKGLNHLKCRGRCPFRISGTDESGTRIRETLKTRDYDRAMRRYNELIGPGAPAKREHAPSGKSLPEAVEAYMSQRSKCAAETKRKYTRIFRYLETFLAARRVTTIDRVLLEDLDAYRLWRGKAGWTWVKEAETLKAFFSFCVDRDWCTKNPAKGLVVDTPEIINEVEPYTLPQIARIISACDTIGKSNYERRRARAMILLMRFAGLRLSDVVTLSRDHIVGNYLVRKAVKNGTKIQIELPGVVLQALDALPQPKAASNESRLYFAGDKSSLRRLVANAWRTLSSVFERSGVERAHPHRFRHTLASELLAKGESIETVSSILGDTPATIRRHYAKWSPEYQSKLDSAIRKIHASGTNLAQIQIEATDNRFDGRLGLAEREGFVPSPHADSTQLTDNVIGPNSPDGLDGQSLAQNRHKKRSTTPFPSLGNPKKGKPGTKPGPSEKCLKPIPQ